MTKEISVLSIMHNPEQTLIELALTLHKEDFEDHVEIVPVFTKLVSDPKYYNVLIFIKLIIKTIDDESIQFTSMNLIDVISELYEKQRTEDSLKLYLCIKEQMPLLIAALEQIHGDTTIDNKIITKPKKQKEVNLKQLIDDHWGYVGGLIVATSYDTESFTLESLEYIYKTSFEHGFKHATQLNK